MSHKTTDRHIDALEPKLTTTRKSKTLCRSKLEAHVGDVLEGCGIPCRHEPITFTFEDLPRGQATPDWITPDPFHNGQIMAVEPKGGETTRAQATFDNFAEKCDDPDDDISAYALVKFKYIKLHRDGITGPGAFFKCLDCGEYFFDFKRPIGDQRQCPHCGGHNVHYETDNINHYANTIAEATWKANWDKREKEILANWQAFDNAKHYEDKLVARMKEVAAELGWTDLIEGQHYHDLTIGSDYAYEPYIPDFVYEELPNQYHLFGHATPPLVIVSMSQMRSENDEIVFEEIREAVARGSAFAKHVICDRDGFHVLDWTTNGEYLPGGIYTCDERGCGKHYIAPTSHECPFCGGTHHHQHTKTTKKEGAAC